MKVLNSRLARCVASCLTVVIVLPTGRAATFATRCTAEFERGALSQDRNARPPAKKNNIIAGLGVNEAGATFEQTSDQSRPVVPDRPTAAQQQDSPPSPVGTAAAPYEKPEGTPASSPAGAAIAPAKQRRAKSFAIRTALIVGAGVAIGVVVAASLGSSSRAHQ